MTHTLTWEGEQAGWELGKGCRELGVEEGHGGPYMELGVVGKSPAPHSSWEVAELGWVLVRHQVWEPLGEEAGPSELGALGYVPGCELRVGCCCWSVGPPPPQTDSPYRERRERERSDLGIERTHLRALWGEW